MKNDQKRIVGFTLIEILIVLTIVSVLLAMAFPVFSRVSEKGRYATCTSNLKQLALATQQYIQDNDGVYPIAVDIKSDGPVIWWHQRLQSYIKYGSVYYCPTLASLDNSYRFTNYTFNRFALNRIDVRAGDSGKPEAAIQLAATTFLNTEDVLLPPKLNGGFGPPDPRLARGVPSPCRQGMDYSSVVHAGGANYSFLDGHVKWLTPEAAAQVKCDSEPPER